MLLNSEVVQFINAISVFPYINIKYYNNKLII